MKPSTPSKSMSKKKTSARQQPRQPTAKKSPAAVKAPPEALTQPLTKPDPPPEKDATTDSEAYRGLVEPVVEAIEKPEPTSEFPRLAVVEEYEGPQSHAVPFDVHFAVTERVKQLEQELEAFRQGDVEENSISKKNRNVKKHRRCPICWERYGGVGRRRWQNPISGRLVRIGLQCDECGINWSAETTIEEINDVVVRSTRIVEIRKFKDGAEKEGAT